MDNGMYADIRSLICRDNDLLLIFHKFELLAVELVLFLSTSETSVFFLQDCIELVFFWSTSETSVNFLQDCIAQYLRRPYFYSPPWEPEIFRLSICSIIEWYRF
jgi:hypothetical protein